ncbi:hypothetical protein Ddye_020188 [Dipteronia dyeriana]|uniref:DUF7588 domain-containing protein n=1 Tax=Dipteronia dyeriana TaxID=168575 RepID=A0AAD9U039_9ROSI|nr:hypothetical protein Ddye_020188 [Dipteronia dyeriana]
MHIGSVQVGIKPLSKIGLNNSLLIVLRDKRITDYKEFIIGMVETTLTYGPIYFQCYPNFSIALNTDEHKEIYLVIDIQTHNYKFLERSSPYKLVDRIHYRVLISSLIPSFIPPSIPTDQTICFNASPSVNVLVPVPVKWENVNFLDDWVKEKVDQPSYKTPMRNLHDFVTEQDETLRISFKSGLSIRENDNSRTSEDFQSARHSLSSQSRLNIARQIPSLILDQRTNLISQYKPTSSETSPSNLEIPNPTRVTNIHKTPEQITQPIHSYHQEGHTSPTPSQVLTKIPEPKESNIDLDFLLNGYLSSNNEELRTKYEKSYNERKRKQFQERWFQCIKILDKEIPFFEWYINRKTLEQQQCLVINQNRIRTYKTKRGEEKQFHPPPKHLEIELPNENPENNNNTTLCTPFIIFDDPLSANIPSSSQQVGIVMRQNNYTNLFLNSIGEQL